MRHAIETVPYWRDRLGSGWQDLRTTIDRDTFCALPLLRRVDIQRHGKELLSERIPTSHGRLIRSETSGSTGRPIVRYGTELTELFWRAFTLRDSLWHKRDLAGRLAAIRLKVESGESAGWGPATDAAYHTGPCALLNIRTDIDAQLDWLESQAPRYLITMASNLLWLAKRSLERGIRLPGLSQARSYGGALPEETRSIVREAWGVEVADIYTAEEAGYIALQCPQFEHYHVQAEGLLVEVLDDMGKQCDPGEIGRVVVTTLHNFAMPLIRYELGDYAEVGEPCPCGRGLPVIRRILGRHRNLLRLPDGRRHWPSFPTDKWTPAAPSVEQLQIVQRSTQDIVLRIVSVCELNPDESSHLIAALQACLGYPFRMTIERVESIARSGNFKFEDFVSEIPD